MTLAARAATKILDLTLKVCETTAAHPAAQTTATLERNAVCLSNPAKKLSALRCRIELGRATPLLKKG
jgi:hypothetical protein